MDDKTNRSLELCRRVVTTESFIEEAKAIYGDLYDYSKVDYKNRDHQVVVGCAIHGDFHVYAREHLDGKGCPTCAKSDKFLGKLREQFGEKFGLENYKYVNSTTPVELICPEHGSFSRIPGQILSSPFGCPECGKANNKKKNEEAHAEALARKEAAKQQKEAEKTERLLRWRDDWLDFYNCRKEYFEGTSNKCDFEDLWLAYTCHIDEYIELIKRGNKSQLAILNIEPIPESDAKLLDEYRRGDTYYLFKGEAANKRVIDFVSKAYKLDLSLMCHYLSHRGCHINFAGNDLIIRNERPAFYDYVGTSDELFKMARENGLFEWEGLKVYVCPFDEIVYLTEDIKMESARYSQDITKWFVIPLNEYCNQGVVTYGCDQYMKLMYSYNIFKTDNEALLFDYLVVGDEYTYEEVGSSFGLAVSTIKTVLRGLEKHCAVEVAKTGSSFRVLNKVSKEMQPAIFIEEYKSLLEDIIAYSKSPMAKFHQAAFDKQKEAICPSTPKQYKTVNIPNSFVGIDFETLYSQRVSACSVGMVKYKEGVIVDRYYSLIRPPFDYPGKSGVPLTWIHGFTEEMLKNERTFDEVLPEMEAFAENLPLVAHNACVERACIHDTSKYYGITSTLPYNSIIDTYPLSRQVEKSMGLKVEGSGSHSLDAVCRRFNVPEMHHHNALDDAEMCGNLLLAFGNILKGELIIEKSSSHGHANNKYNAEDKVQRTDLENVADNPFKDCGVVLTGFSTALSQEYGHKLKELGAKVCTGVSSKTKWLICGPNAGPSKMEKAKQLNANIINEEEFLKMI